jgi:hypothetical protein
MARCVPLRPMSVQASSTHQYGVNNMSWTKPEAEVVAVTMEVTAYVATL